MKPRPQRRELENGDIIVHRDDLPTFPGALLDTRSQEEKERDYKFNEIVASADPVQWTEKKDKDLRVFGHQDQNGQSSCMANAARKTMRVVFKENNNLDLDFSSGHIYRRRRNYPEGGMALDDLMSVIRRGATIYDLAPTDGQTEAEVNALQLKPYMETVGDVFKIANTVDVPVGDIDAVASIIQKTKKAVVLMYYFTESEWSRLYPEIKVPGLDVRGNSTLRHGVAAVDFTLRNGVKHLVIDDSALFSGLDRRFVSHVFHSKRNYGAAYPINFVFNGVSNKPQHYFAFDLAFNEISSEVMWLQRCLQFDGTFPSNVTINPVAVGNYYGLTAAAVLAFQKKYGIASPSELDALAGKKVGPATRAKLNQLFA